MINVGCDYIDNFLKNPDKEVVLIYGPSASGKTTLAIQAAIKNAEKGLKTLYIDTEGGFKPERVKQINPDPKILEQIILLRVKDFMEQRLNFRKLKKLVDLGNISLVIIDTIGMHYRLYLQKNSYGANMCLRKQFRILNEIVKELGIPVIVTNQVYMDIEGRGFRPTGGEITFNNCQRYIELRKEPTRKLILKKPSPERYLNIDIASCGLKFSSKK